MSNKKLCQSNDKLPQFLSFDFFKHQIHPKFQNHNVLFDDYYLALANIIPHNFESYAICLHPIGYYQNEQYIEPKISNRKSILKAFEILVNDDMNLDNLNDLYRLEGELFENNSKLSYLSKDHLLYLSNGDCSDVQFNFMIDTLKNLVDNDIYYYYELLKIIGYSEYDFNKISELLFKGEILTHREVQQHSKISTQPTILFDDSEYDIYPITPKYQWVKKN